jgi:DNA ligase-1
MNYSVLANFFERVENLSGRLDMIEETSELFRMIMTTSPTTLVPCVYLCCNELWPAYMGRELGIGDTILIKAIIGLLTNETPANLKLKVKSVGDLGQVTEELLSKKKENPKKPLTIENVFEELRTLTLMQGKAVVNKKVLSIQNLLTASQGCESKYLIRCIQGKMRIGLQESSVIKALAKALAAVKPDFAPSVEKATKAIEQAYVELPNHDLVIPCLLSVPISVWSYLLIVFINFKQELNNHCKLTPGVPVKSMLGKPTKVLSLFFL